MSGKKESKGVFKTISSWFVKSDKKDKNRKPSDSDVDAKPGGRGHGSLHGDPAPQESRHAAPETSSQYNPPQSTRQDAYEHFSEEQGYRYENRRDPDSLSSKRLPAPEEHEFAKPFAPAPRQYNERAVDVEDDRSVSSSGDFEEDGAGPAGSSSLSRTKKEVFYAVDRDNMDWLLEAAVKFVSTEGDIKLKLTSDVQKARPLVVFCKNDSKLQEDINHAFQQTRGGKDVMLVVVTDKKDQWLKDTKATKKFGQKVCLFWDHKKDKFRCSENYDTMVWIRDFLRQFKIKAVVKFNRTDSLRRSTKKKLGGDASGCYHVLKPEQMEEKLVQSAITFFHNELIDLQKVNKPFPLPLVLFCAAGDGVEAEVEDFMKINSLNKEDIKVIVFCPPSQLRNYGQDSRHLPDFQRLRISPFKPVLDESESTQNTKITNIVKKFLNRTKNRNSSSTDQQREEPTRRRESEPDGRSFQYDDDDGSDCLMKEPSVSGKVRGGENGSYDKSRVRGVHSGDMDVHSGVTDVHSGVRNVHAAVRDVHSGGYSGHGYSAPGSGGTGRPNKSSAWSSDYGQEYSRRDINPDERSMLQDEYYGVGELNPDERSMQQRQQNEYYGDRQINPDQRSMQQREYYGGEKHQDERSMQQRQQYYGGDETHPDERYMQQRQQGSYHDDPHPTGFDERSANQRTHPQYNRAYEQQQLPGMPYQELHSQRTQYEQRTPRDSYSRETEGRSLRPMPIGQETPMDVADVSSAEHRTRRTRAQRQQERNEEEGLGGSGSYGDRLPSRRGDHEEVRTEYRGHLEEVRTEYHGRHVDAVNKPRSTRRSRGGQKRKTVDDLQDLMGGLSLQEKSRKIDPELHQEKRSQEDPVERPRPLKPRRKGRNEYHKRYTQR